MHRTAEHLATWQESEMASWKFLGLLFKPEAGAGDAKADAPVIEAAARLAQSNNYIHILFTYIGGGLTGETAMDFSKTQEFSHEQNPN